MTRSHYGILAGIAGAAFAAAWWWHRHDAMTSAMPHSGHDRGEVIFRNTPEPSGMGGGPT